MDLVKVQFLEGVLGLEGAKALSKAANRSPQFENIIIPYAIMSWLSQNEGNLQKYEGEMPGVPNSYLMFNKNDSGYSGKVEIDDKIWNFSEAAPLNLASIIGVAIGVDADKIPSDIQDLDIHKLVKSIDLLVKSKRIVTELQKKVLDPNLGYKFSHTTEEVSPGQFLTKVNVHSADGEHVGAATFVHQGKNLVPGSVVVDEAHQRRGIASAMYSHAQKHTGKVIVPSGNQTTEGAALWAGNAANKQFGKIEKPLKGKANEPTFEAPQPPQSPTKQSNRTQQVRITKSQSKRICKVCNQGLFQSNKFVGCLCVRDLAKNVESIQEDGDGFTLKMNLDFDETLTILDILRGG